MIDVKELRIGNLLQENSDEAIILEITEISKNGHVKFIPIDGSQIPMIGGYVDVQTNPIPLTEEWLKKFGFDTDLSIHLNTPDITLDFIKGKEANKIYFYPQLFKQAELSCDDNQCIGLNRIQFVHQLQNLYFCLTGKELQITH